MINPLFETAIYQRFLPILHPFHTVNHVFLISWWNDAKPTFASLRLYAFDTLAIPAMSAERERLISGTKKLITPEETIWQRASSRHPSA
jgi:hypothetical protein